MSNKNYLIHYGVKGMKWGRRSAKIDTSKGVGLRKRIDARSKFYKKELEAGRGTSVDYTGSPRSMVELGAMNKAFRDFAKEKEEPANPIKSIKAKGAQIIKDIFEPRKAMYNEKEWKKQLENEKRLSYRIGNIVDSIIRRGY